jgi:hypothetical protein
MFKHSVGDKVTHMDYGENELVGVVVRNKLDWEVDEDMNDCEPWCGIAWFNEGQIQMGNEHQDSLVHINSNRTENIKELLSLIVDWESADKQFFIEDLLS